MPDVKQSPSKGTLQVHTTPDVKTSKGKPPDVDGWLDRDASCELLGCSVQVLVNQQRAGRLHPVYVQRIDSIGRRRMAYLYDPKELARVPRRSRVVIERSPGDITSAAFELFRDGRGLDEVAIEIRVEADQVVGLYERWLDLSKARYVIGTAAWEELEKHVGKFGSVAELIDRVASVVSSSAADNTIAISRARHAIEAAVDAALGEVARQQGGIAEPIGVEARGAGVSVGAALLTE